MIVSILKCGCFGIGNAGGQITSLAHKNFGFKALCANVSSADLEVLEGVDTILIGDGMGSGKDRNLAKKYAKENIKSLISKDVFSEFINDLQVVFVITSVAGGSGGGMGPLTTDVLSNVYPDTIFIYVGVLPAYKESLRSQRNTLECLKEIVDIQIPYMLYDNNRVKDSISVTDAMTKVNHAIVEDLCILRGDHNLLSTVGMVDGRELHTLLSTPGLINVTSAVGFKEKDLDQVGVEDLLIKNLGTTLSCEFDRNRAIEYMCTIVNLTKDIDNKFDKTLPKFKEVVGEPEATFDHYYEIKPEETERFANRVHVISAGLGVPDDRLKRIVERIDEADRLKKSAKSSSILDNYEKVTRDERKVNTDIDLDDILNKYN